MNKKLLATLILIAPLAHSEELLAPPTKGIQVVPLARMSIPEKLKQDLMKEKQEEKEKGFQETNDKDSYIHYILSIPRNAPQEIKSSSNISDPYDTHLKANFSDIKLAFDYKPINVSNIIAYAAVGGYIKEDKEGWTGIRVFFTDPIGSCSYTYNNLKLSHGAAQLSAETTEYLVNKKPSSISVEGNINAGFLYTIDWFTPESMTTLECVNMLYDIEIKSKLIELANKIDKG